MDFNLLFGSGMALLLLCLGGVGALLLIAAALSLWRYYSGRQN